MNRTAEFTTLYVCESHTALPLNPDSWLTKNQPFTGPLVAKGFWGPGEQLPRYVEIVKTEDNAEENIFMTTMIWWCINNGILFDVRDRLSFEPYSAESADQKITSKTLNASSN
jgi:hypothetical protein